MTTAASTPSAAVASPSSAMMKDYLKRQLRYWLDGFKDDQLPRDFNSKTFNRTQLTFTKLALKPDKVAMLLRLAPPLLVTRAVCSELQIKVPSWTSAEKFVQEPLSIRMADLFVDVRHINDCEDHVRQDALTRARAASVEADPIGSIASMHAFAAILMERIEVRIDNCQLRLLGRQGMVRLRCDITQLHARTTNALWQDMRDLSHCVDRAPDGLLKTRFKYVSMVCDAFLHPAETSAAPLQLLRSHVIAMRVTTFAHRRSRQDAWGANSTVIDLNLDTLPFDIDIRSVQHLYDFVRLLIKCPLATHYSSNSKAINYSSNFIGHIFTDEAELFFAYPYDADQELKSVVHLSSMTDANGGLHSPQKQPLGRKFNRCSKLPLPLVIALLANENERDLIDNILSSGSYGSAGGGHANEWPELAINATFLEPTSDMLQVEVRWHEQCVEVTNMDAFLLCLQQLGLCTPQGNSKYIGKVLRDRLKMDGKNPLRDLQDRGGLRLPQPPMRETVDPMNQALEEEEKQEDDADDVFKATRLEDVVLEDRKTSSSSSCDEVPHTGLTEVSLHEEDDPGMQSPSDIEAIDDLMEAAKEGDLALFQRLCLTLRRRHIAPDCAGYMGWTAAHWAAREGHIHILDFLRSEEVNLDLLDRKGDSLLHKAAANGQTRVCQWLLQQGFNVQALNKNGLTPLDLAEQHLAMNKSSDAAACEALLAQAFAHTF
ncbi:hypothetical protein ATCC90586_000185 [Pythium insidiosum]|nr:hypothetical protein ATCC90586_000185 [Pythium insidiosum]